MLLANGVEGKGDRFDVYICLENGYHACLKADPEYYEFCSLLG